MSLFGWWWFSRWWWESTIFLIFGGAFMGVAVGVFQAVYYRRQAAQLALSRWEDYPTP